MANDTKTVVLVADDEPSTRALVAGHLRTKGYRVIEASDGDEAWELAHEHLPHLVVLDVMMPGMSGWEVCRKIREAVSLAHTGVVMLTGIGEHLNEMTSPLYGADAYVDKPFEFSALDKRVEETLARRQGSSTLGRPDSADRQPPGDSAGSEPQRKPSKASKTPRKAAAKSKAAPAVKAPVEKAAARPAPKTATKPAKKKAAQKSAKPKSAKKKAAQKPAKPKSAKKKAAPKPAKSKPAKKKRAAAKVAKPAARKPSKKKAARKPAKASKSKSKRSAKSKPRRARAKKA